MKPLERVGLTGQTTDYLRAAISSGRWTGKLPGVRPLANDCGVSHDVVRAALQRLEREGLVVAEGNGRSRTVQARALQRKESSEVAVLLNLPLAEEDSEFQQALTSLRSMVEESGRQCRFAGKCLRDLRGDVTRVARLVNRETADVWVVVGATREVLEWFDAQGKTFIALCGCCANLPVAGTGRLADDGFRDAMRHLMSLGHRRIVYVGPQMVRFSRSAGVIRIMGEELGRAGVAAGDYHCPDWDETPDGLQCLLARIFRVTPPTALIVDYANWLAGALDFLACRGLRVPEDVSLVCMNHDPTTAWHRPRIAHLGGSEVALAGVVLRWINSVARGRVEKKFIPMAAPFIRGDSTAPPREQVQTF